MIRPSKEKTTSLQGTLQIGSRNGIVLWLFSCHGKYEMSLDLEIFVT